MTSIRQKSSIHIQSVASKDVTLQIFARCCLSCPSLIAIWRMVIFHARVFVLDTCILHIHILADILLRSIRIFISQRNIWSIDRKCVEKSRAFNYFSKIRTSYIAVWIGGILLRAESGYATYLALEKRKCTRWASFEVVQGRTARTGRREPRKIPASKAVLQKEKINREEKKTKKRCTKRAQRRQTASRGESSTRVECLSSRGSF